VILQPFTEPHHRILPGPSSTEAKSFDQGGDINEAGERGVLSGKLSQVGCQMHPPVMEPNESLLLRQQLVNFSHIVKSNTSK